LTNTALKLQLSKYSSALFDAEVQFYPGYARGETEMKSWLKETALCVASEVLNDMKPYKAFHNLHCSAEERKETIVHALKQRIDYWVERGPVDVPDESTAAVMEEPRPQIPLPIIDAIPVEPKPSRKRDAQFPNRAIWLRERLAERGWDHNDLPRHGGPDRKTALKILAGGEVRPDVLDKLAKALSFSKKVPKVTILDIPTT
jgi:hypothetical protein